MQLGDSWGYKGIVKIDSNITCSTKEIILNSKEIEVQKAEIFGKDGLLGCIMFQRPSPISGQTTDIMHDCCRDENNSGV